MIVEAQSDDLVEGVCLDFSVRLCVASVTSLEPEARYALVYTRRL